MLDFIKRLSGLLFFIALIWLSCFIYYQLYLAFFKENNCPVNIYVTDCDEHENEHEEIELEEKDDV